jgi:NADH-quinone oxidoreductase subunit C
MTEKEMLKIVDEIASEFGISAEARQKRRVWLDTSRETFLALCRWLKKRGFEHLSAISATDWLEEGKYELAYHLWSYQDYILLTVKIKVDRDNAIADSVVDIWHESAQAHEREINELFRVNFKGNDNLTPLFLEDWQGPPPFRKDFDWRDYARENSYDRENERERSYYD